MVLTSIENETKKRSNSLLWLKPSLLIKIVSHSRGPWPCASNSFVFGKDFPSPLFDQSGPRREIERVQPKSRTSFRRDRWEESRSNNGEFHLDRVDVGQLDCGQKLNKKQFDWEKEKFLWTMFGLMKKAMEPPPFSPAKCAFSSSSSNVEKNQLNDDERNRWRSRLRPSPSHPDAFYPGQTDTQAAVSQFLSHTPFLQSRERHRKAEDNDVYDAGFSQCLTWHTPEQFDVFPILSQWNDYNQAKRLQAIEKCFIVHLLLVRYETSEQNCRELHVNTEGCLRFPWIQLSPGNPRRWRGLKSHVFLVSTSSVVLETISVFVTRWVVLR